MKKTVKELPQEVQMVMNQVEKYRSIKKDQLHLLLRNAMKKNGKEKDVVLIACALNLPFFAEYALWKKIAKKDIEGLKLLLGQFNRSFSYAGASFLATMLRYFEYEEMSSELIGDIYYASMDTTILRYIKNDTALLFNSLLTKKGHVSWSNDFRNRMEWYANNPR